LLALSANSPLADGGDTGRRSERAERLLLMPTGGTPPVLESWDDWRAATGGDSTRRHWDAWPRPEYGTLEVRVMDMQTDVRRSAGFAAIVRALLRTVPAAAGGPYDRGLYARRRAEATRLPPDRAEVQALAARIDPVLEGTDRQLAQLVLEGRPEAERQLEIAAADGIQAVPRDVVERTLG
jgi:carboxylate-amine ligase